MLFPSCAANPVRNQDPLSRDSNMKTTLPGEAESNPNVIAKNLGQRLTSKQPNTTRNFEVVDPAITGPAGGRKHRGTVEPADKGTAKVRKSLKATFSAGSKFQSPPKIVSWSRACAWSQAEPRNYTEQSGALGLLHKLMNCTVPILTARPSPSSPWYVSRSSHVKQSLTRVTKPNQPYTCHPQGKKG